MQALRWSQMLAALSPRIPPNHGPDFGLTGSAVAAGGLAQLWSSRMQQHVDELIRGAIRRRRLLMFLYRGRIRVVEPHLYGVNTAQHTVLSAWQKNQASRVSPRDCWRTYFVNHMRRVEMLPIEFEAPRETYNPNRPPMARIIDQLPGDATVMAASARRSATGSVEDPLQLRLPLDAATGESR